MSRPLAPCGDRSEAPEWIDGNVARGYGLTVRHCEVLMGLARGSTDGVIARSLGLAEATVNTHLRGLFRKLGVSSRAAAGAVAYDLGVLRTRAQRVALARAVGLRVAS